MRVWYGSPGLSVGFVGLTDGNHEHQFCVFYSAKQLQRLLKGVEESSAKRSLIDVAMGIMNETTAEVGQAPIVCSGDIAHMLWYFIQPVLGQLTASLCGIPAEKPLPDEVVHGAHSTVVFIPPRRDDAEPAGIFLYPSEAVITAVFSKEQARSSLVRRGEGTADTEDRDEKLGIIERSELPEYSEQKPLNLGEPFGYYLFCGFLLRNK